MTISIGEKAPDFTLLSQHGEAVRLSDFQRKKFVVLYFYVSDTNPACALEARSFRNMYDAFRDIGAEVIGISGDTVESHRRFAAENLVPFILLSDEKNSVRRQYGIPSILGIISVRVTLVIDKKGAVRQIIYSQLNVKRHIEEAFKTLDKLEKEETPKLELVS